MSLYELKNKTILITGSAGFIGFHLSFILLENGVKVVGLDNFNNYYDPTLKEDRNKILEKFSNFKLYRGNLEDLKLLEKIFKENKLDKVCNLAAQAGVRHSMSNSKDYISSNLIGFFNLLETAKNFGVKDFIYASSSSVYGEEVNDKALRENENTDKPISFYAATKKSNELIAYVYHKNFNMNLTGLRFFSVYGPFGRPDMAYFSFTKNILEDKEIKIFNQGKNFRDFTYIGDIVEGIISALIHSYSYEIFNLGNGKKIEFSYFLELLEKSLNKKSTNKIFLPRELGDAITTQADISQAREKLNFNPKINIEEGIKIFVKWYREYFKI